MSKWEAGKERGSAGRGGQGRRKMCSINVKSVFLYSSPACSPFSLPISLARGKLPQLIKAKLGAGRGWWAAIFAGSRSTASLNKWIAISTAWLRCHFRWVSTISCGSVSSGCQLPAARRRDALGKQTRVSHCGQPGQVPPLWVRAATTMTTVCTLYEAHHYEAAMG